MSKAPPASAPEQAPQCVPKKSGAPAQAAASAQSSRVCRTPTAVPRQQAACAAWRSATRRRAHLAGAALAGRSLAGLSGLSAAGAAGAGAPASIQLASTTSFTRRLYSRLSACGPLRGHRSLPPALRRQHQSNKGCMTSICRQKKASAHKKRKQAGKCAGSCLTTGRPKKYHFKGFKTINTQAHEWERRHIGACSSHLFSPYRRAASEFAGDAGLGSHSRDCGPTDTPVSIF